MTGALTVTDRARLARGGIVPMDTEEALELLDAALAVGEPWSWPARLDPGRTAGRRRSGPLGTERSRASPTVGPRTASTPAALPESTGEATASSTGCAE